MSGLMPKDELRMHRRTIVDFLAAWGYPLARGAILPCEFKDRYGLKIQYENGWTITDLPGTNGETSEYFLRDCLSVAHSSLWKSLRADHIDQTDSKDDLGNSDGGIIARWAALLMADETKAVSGQFSERNDSNGPIISRFTGSVSGQNLTLKLDENEILIKMTLPESVRESISFKTVAELFEGMPQCSDPSINDRLAQTYVMSAEERGKDTVFRILDHNYAPMPGANIGVLWRRVKNTAPDTVLLQFPPHVDYSVTMAAAAQHRERICRLLEELDYDASERFHFPQLKAAA